MRFTGRLKEPVADYHSGKLTILFEPIEDFRQTYDELKDYEKLTLEIKPYRAKRSLDANSYLWVLLDKLADKLNITRWQAYLNELKSHGAFEYIPLREKRHLSGTVSVPNCDRSWSTGSKRPKR